MSLAVAGQWRDKSCRLHQFRTACCFLRVSNGHVRQCGRRAFSCRLSTPGTLAGYHSRSRQGFDEHALLFSFQGFILVDEASTLQLYFRWLRHSVFHREVEQSFYFCCLRKKLFLSLRSSIDPVMIRLAWFYTLLTGELNWDCWHPRLRLYFSK